MGDISTKVLRMRKVLLGRDFYQGRQVRRPRLKLGNRFADWTICPSMLNENSIVFSVGAGRDISFDLELIDRFKSTVHVFDPTPDSIKWIDTLSLPEQFNFYPFGLSDRDGQINFIRPEDSLYGSLRIDYAPGQNDADLNLPVRSLASIIKELSVDRIDVLKMDIEGAEYSVINDVISSPVEITQVLIEFHHRFDAFSVQDTKEAIKMLNSSGYHIFNVSASGEEFSFILEKPEK